jgi:hypothetical protein
MSQFTGLSLNRNAANRLYCCISLCFQIVTLIMLCAGIKRNPGRIIRRESFSTIGQLFVSCTASCGLRSTPVGAKLTSTGRYAPQAAGFSSGLSAAPHALPHAAGFSSGLSEEPHAAGLSAAPHAADGVSTAFFVQPNKFESAMICTS